MFNIKILEQQKYYEKLNTITNLIIYYILLVKIKSFTIIINIYITTITIKSLY